MKGKTERNILCNTPKTSLAIIVIATNVKQVLWNQQISSEKLALH